MQAELEEYNIKVSIPEPFLQKHLSRYFAHERVVRDIYVKARNEDTGIKDQGLSASEYNQVVAQTAINIGWCKADCTDAGELAPQAANWVFEQLFDEVIKHAILPKA